MTHPEDVIGVENASQTSLFAEDGTEAAVVYVEPLNGILAFIDIWPPSAKVLGRSTGRSTYLAICSF